jgi:hypothetical protein
MCCSGEEGEAEGELAQAAEDVLLEEDWNLACILWHFSM